MKEHPILFKTEMVRAILDGRKTQTRRILKPQPDLGMSEFERYSHIEVGFYNPVVIDKYGNEQPGDEIFGAYTDDGEWGWKCSYGQVGDRLWVKETYSYITKAKNEYYTKRMVIRILRGFPLFLCAVNIHALHLK